MKQAPILQQSMARPSVFCKVHLDQLHSTVGTWGSPCFAHPRCQAVVFHSRFQSLLCSLRYPGPGIHTCSSITCNFSLWYHCYTCDTELCSGRGDDLPGPPFCEFFLAESYLSSFWHLSHLNIFLVGPSILVWCTRYPPRDAKDLLHPGSPDMNVTTNSALSVGHLSNPSFPSSICSGVPTASHSVPCVSHVVSPISSTYIYPQTVSSRS